jgi:hypothetical protein
VLPGTDVIIFKNDFAKKITKILAFFDAKQLAKLCKN